MDSRSLRLVVIGIAMCVLFALVVGNAFKFLPDDPNSVTPISVEDLNTERADNNERREKALDEENMDEVDILKERVRELERELEQSQKIDNTETKSKPYEEFSEEEKNTEITSNFYETIENGNKNFNSGNYEAALMSYQEALNGTTKSSEVSMAYVGISKVYAMQRRYGSAISYAQKANNAYSTYETKVLLAKLNYVTGKTVQAEQAMKSLLESGF